MKKLSRTELKNVMGGTEEVGDLGTDPNCNVYCDGRENNGTGDAYCTSLEGQCKTCSEYLNGPGGRMCVR